MAEGFAAQQVKELKNISRRRRKKRFDRERRLEIKKKKKIEIKIETTLSKSQRDEIKFKVIQDRNREKVRNIILFIISIPITFIILKILFAQFKQIL